MYRETVAAAAVAGLDALEQRAHLLAAATVLLIVSNTAGRGWDPPAGGRCGPAPAPAPNLTAAVDPAGSGIWNRASCSQSVRGTAAASRDTGTCAVTQRAFVEAMAADLPSPVQLNYGSLLFWYRDCMLPRASGTVLSEDVDVAVYVDGWNALNIHRVQWRAIMILLSRLHLYTALGHFLLPPLFSVQRGGSVMAADGTMLPVKVWLDLNLFAYKGRFNFLEPRATGCHFDIWVVHTNGTHDITYIPFARSPLNDKVFGTYATATYRRLPLAEIAAEDAAMLGVPGTKLYAPCPAADRIAEHFGEDWRSPILKEDWVDPMSAPGESHRTVYTGCPQPGGNPVLHPGLFVLERLMVVATITGLGFRARSNLRATVTPTPVPK